MMKMSIAEEVVQLSSVDLILSSAGSHWVKALFLRPNTFWFELVCPNVTDTMMWFHPNFRTRSGVAYGGMAGAFRLRYHWIAARNCPPSSPRVQYNHWNPMRTALTARRGSQPRPIHTLSAQPFATCSWKRPKRGVNLEGSAVPMSTFPTQESAMAACESLGTDCTAVYRGSRSWWKLRRGRENWDSSSGILVQEESCNILRH